MRDEENCKNIYLGGDSALVETSSERHGQLLLLRIDARLGGPRCYLIDNFLITTLQKY